jgi:transcriptional regulator with XRE-family HTH domain
VDYGKNLRLARRWAGITQMDLAKKCGLAVITIRQYESGKRKPSAENWFAIANALHLGIDELNDAEYLPTGPFNPETIMEEVLLEDAKDKRNLKYRLYAAFSSLNDAGQSIAVERIEELTQIAKYQRAQTDAEGTHSQEESNEN